MAVHAHRSWSPAQRLTVLPKAQEHILAQDDRKGLSKAVKELSQAFALRMLRSSSGHTPRILRGSLKFRRFSVTRAKKVVHIINQLWIERPRR